MRGLGRLIDKAEHGPSSYAILNRDTGRTLNDGHFMRKSAISQDTDRSTPNRGLIYESSPNASSTVPTGKIIMIEELIENSLVGYLK